MTRWMRVGWLTVALSLAAPVALAQPATPTPGEARSMAFQPGLGDAAQERVPGGRLVVLAYMAVLGLLGGYVTFVARRAARLDGELRRFEDDLARRGLRVGALAAVPTGDADDDADDGADDGAKGTGKEPRA